MKLIFLYGWLQTVFTIDALAWRRTAIAVGQIAQEQAEGSGEGKLSVTAALRADLSSAVDEEFHYWF